MRIAIAAALAPAIALVAVPAIAQYRVPPPPPPAETVLADRLNDPMVQMGMAGAIAGMVGSVMDLRVGPLASLGADVHPAETLRDLSARRGGDPYPEARIYRDTRLAAAGVGRMADGIAAMMPELRATAARLADQVEGLSGRYDRNYEYDYDY